MGNDSVGRKVMVRTGWMVRAALVMAFVAASHLHAKPRITPVLVDQVTSVDCTLEKSNPPNALVKAQGTVTTGGYKNPRLVRVVYIKPPADGFQELRFLVDPPPPHGGVIQVITSLETPILRIKRISSWMKGVRVTGAHNKIEKACS